MKYISFGIVGLFVGLYFGYQINFNPVICNTYTPLPTAVYTPVEISVSSTVSSDSFINPAKWIENQAHKLK